MRRRCLALSLAAAAGGAHALPPSAPAATPSERYALSAPAPRYTLAAAGVDRARELAADAGAPKWRPLRYAVAREIHNAYVSRSIQSAGEWLDLPDGMALWRLPVHADGALSLDFGFRKLFLPPRAQLFVGNGAQRLGPYSDADNPRNGEFWTPLVHGDDALIEVLLPQAMKPYLEIDLGTVHAGFRNVLAPQTAAKSFADPGEGSGSCNVDVVCHEGDPWRAEINAEAIVIFNGGFCSGQLVNDTRGDHVPYLTTANHCIDNVSDANSVVVYWKYESPVCRAPFSTDSAAPVPTNDAIAQVGGSDLLATYQPADFTLLRLRTTPPQNAHVYFNGWDRTEAAFDGAAVFHHPQADAKRFSEPAGTVTVDDRSPNQTSAPGQHHWRVDHYTLGTTEEGSSGSGLLDGSHRLRGVLSGGAALCTDLQGDDYYGRLSTAWDGGGTPDSRVRDWLDPNNSGALTVDGNSSESAPAVSLTLSADVLQQSQQLTLTATAAGGTPPYRYAFDLDGDGVADNLDANAATMIASYPHAFSGNVRVTVSDASGQSGAASHALIVQAADVEFSSCGFLCAGGVNQTLCGTSDAQPGARASQQVHLKNTGAAATHNAYAVFAPNSAQSNGSARVTIETPAVPLPDLAPQAETTVTVLYDVDQASTCGAHYEIDYIGSVDDHGFSGSAAPVVTRTIDMPCQPAVCSAQTAQIIPKRGNFFDPNRAGSGLTQLTALVPGIDPVFFGAWFTGDAQRQPTWFIVQDALHDSQVNATLYATHLNAPDQFPEIGIPVGSAQVSVVSETKFVYTWTLNGKADGAIYVPLLNDSQSTFRSWFNVDEGGWGTFDELFPSVGAEGRPFMFNLAFLYDGAGNARWTTGQDGQYEDGDVLTEVVARPSCPSCIWLDYTIGAQPVGPLHYTFGSGPNPTINTNLAFPPAFPGTWIRSDLPVVPLVQ